MKSLLHEDAGSSPAGSRFTQRTWLFDLDNTLHNASAHIFPQIHVSMMAYICRHLNVDEAEATRLRQTYWKRYGATLLGMMRHHGTDPRLDVVTLVVWLSVAFVLRYSSLAALVAATAAPLVAFLLWGDDALVVAVGVMSMALIGKHWLNLQRLMAGKETKIGVGKKG